MKSHRTMGIDTDIKNLEGFVVDWTQVSEEIRLLEAASGREWHLELKRKRGENREKLMRPKEMVERVNTVILKEELVKEPELFLER